MSFFYQEVGLTLLKIDSIVPLSKAESKKVQRDSVNSILIDLQLKDLVSFNEYGKPEISENQHISISHDKNFCGVFLNENPCGLDIQTMDEKIIRLKNKFCNSSELRWAKSLEELTTIWSCKESIFKVFGTEVPFADSINVLPFGSDEQQLTAIYSGVHGKFNFKLERMQLKSTFVITTSIPK